MSRLIEQNRDPDARFPLLQSRDEDTVPPVEHDGRGIPLDIGVVTREIRDYTFERRMLLPLNPRTGHAHDSALLRRSIACLLAIGSAAEGLCQFREQSVIAAFRISPAAFQG